MLLDGGGIPHSTTLTADVCVIGAGPAGLTLAGELRGRGLDVIVVESGGAARRTGDALGGEISPDAQPYVRFAHAFARGFGGTSLRWLGRSSFRCRPLDPLDFEARPEVGRDGWPFDRAHLDPYYERAHPVLGLGPYDYDPQRWSSPDAEDLTVFGDLQGVETAIFQFGPSDSFVRRREEFDQASGIRVVTGATVLEIVIDDPGTAARVSRLVVAATPQRTKAAPHVFAVEARTVALAAGGVENARLLLLSNRRHPAGLGNAHDLVGRHYMEHPHVRSGLMLPDDPGVLHRLDLYAKHHAQGARVKGKLRLSEDVLREEGLLGSAWYVTPVDRGLASDAGHAAIDLRQTVAFRRAVPGTPRRLGSVARHPLTALRGARHVGAGPLVAARLQAMAEQLPKRDSRVTLGSRRDVFGRPVAQLRWRVSAEERASLRRTQETLDAAVRRAGLGRLERLLGDEDPPALINGGYHHMGTTRMHASPRRGVVDPDGRVHGIANLYVAGSSVFPTGGYANPTLTVVALALRLADHIARLHRVASQPREASTLDS